MSAHAEVRALMQRYQIRTKKRLGQNFLVDGAVLDDIARFATRLSADGMIEIGPGPGTLTRRIAGTGQPTVAIEKDPVLAEMLREELSDLANVEIVEGDALDGELKDRMNAVNRPAVVGNIPYNISSALIVRLVDQRQHLGPVTLLMQREVVDRLLAGPGSKTYGRLSVLLQLYAEPHRGRLVAPGAFWPAPRVQSAVVQWTWRSTPAVKVGDPQHFERVVKTAFGQRRKTLRNALRAGFHDDRVRNAAASGLDLGRRAEQLSLADFSELAEALGATDS